MKKLCSINSCSSYSKSRGLCQTHYSRWWRHGTTEFRPRLNYGRIPSCHPKEKHQAHGLCKNCYQQHQRNVLGKIYKHDPEAARLYYLQNRDHLRELNRWQHIKRTYNLTKNDFARLLAMQDNVCAICNNLLKKGNTHVDHNHNTNRVRGLLCGNCNRALGFLKDDPKATERAVEYLRNDGVTAERLAS